MEEVDCPGGGGADPEFKFTCIKTASRAPPGAFPGFLLQGPQVRSPHPPKVSFLLYVPSKASSEEDRCRRGEHLETAGGEGGVLLWDTTVAQTGDPVPAYILPRASKFLLVPGAHLDLQCPWGCRRLTWRWGGSYHWAWWD